MFKKKLFTFPHDKDNKNISDFSRVSRLLIRLSTAFYTGAEPVS